MSAATSITSITVVVLPVRDEDRDDHPREKPVRIPDRSPTRDWEDVATPQSEIDVACGGGGGDHAARGGGGGDHAGP